MTTWINSIARPKVIAGEARPGGVGGVSVELDTMKTFLLFGLYFVPYIVPSGFAVYSSITLDAPLLDSA